MSLELYHSPQLYHFLFIQSVEHNQTYTKTKLCLMASPSSRILHSNGDRNRREKLLQYVKDKRASIDCSRRRSIERHDAGLTVETSKTISTRSMTKVSSTSDEIGTRSMTKFSCTSVERPIDPTISALGLSKLVAATSHGDRIAFMAKFSKEKLPPKPEMARNESRQDEASTNANRYESVSEETRDDDPDHMKDFLENEHHVARSYQCSDPSAFPNPKSFSISQRLARAARYSKVVRRNNTIANDKLSNGNKVLDTESTSDNQVGLAPKKHKPIFTYKAPPKISEKLKKATEYAEFASQTTALHKAKLLSTSRPISNGDLENDIRSTEHKTSSISNQDQGVKREETVSNRKGPIIGKSSSSAFTPLASIDSLLISKESLGEDSCIAEIVDEIFPETEDFESPRSNRKEKELLSSKDLESLLTNEDNISLSMQMPKPNHIDVTATIENPPAGTAVSMSPTDPGMEDSLSLTEKIIVADGTSAKDIESQIKTFISTAKSYAVSLRSKTSKSDTETDVLQVTKSRSSRIERGIFSKDTDENLKSRSSSRESRWQLNLKMLSSVFLGEDHINDRNVKRSEPAPFDSVYVDHNNDECSMITTAL